MKTIKILYVEDEITIRKNHILYMKNNFDVTLYEATNGIEGFKAYKEYKPDIIITDLHMPQMCGLEMIEEIRKEDTMTKIIVFSAHSDQERLLRAIKLNLTDYKIKPIKRATLYEVVEKALNDLQTPNLLFLTKECYFNIDTKELINNEQPIKLTKNEALLLESLISKPNTLFSSHELFNAVWDYEKEYSLDSIRTLVKKLRKKLPPDTIENIYGAGYKVHII